MKVLASSIFTAVLFLGGLSACKEGKAPAQGSQPAAEQQVTYKCAGCGKTAQAAASAAAPSC